MMFLHNSVTDLLNTDVDEGDFLNRQHHRKVPLGSFHLNGHAAGFHPQTLKLKPPCTA